MASIKFLLKTRSKNTDEGTLYLQIINNRKDKTEISLRQKLKPGHWNAERQRIKSAHPHSTKLNVFIRNERNAYEQLINDKLAKGEKFTVKQVVAERKAVLNPKENKANFVDFFRDYVATNPENLKFNTIKSYRTCLNSLTTYSPNLTFSNFTESWVQNYEKYLTKDGQAINTVADKMKVLKKITRVCLRNGKLKESPFINYKGKNEPGKRKYLTKEEFKRFCDVNAEYKTHKYVKNAFMFGCLTGLRFSDMATLTPENIKEENGVYRMYIRMQKTNDILSMKLPQKAVAIIQQYDYPNRNPLLPILSYTPDIYANEAALKKAISRRNAYFNKVVKLLCTKAGIDKSISFHCARHTFATLSLDLDIPIQVVSKMLGHKNLKETMIYAKIMDKQKDAAVDAWDNL